MRCDFKKPLDHARKDHKSNGNGEERRFLYDDQASSSRNISVLRRENPNPLTDDWYGDSSRGAEGVACVGNRTDLTRILTVGGLKVEPLRGRGWPFLDPVVASKTFGSLRDHAWL